MDHAASGRARALLASILKGVLPWTALAFAVIVPIAVAAASPLLAWREPIYVTAGFAGVIAMSLLLIQPLLVGGYLPGLSGLRGRRAHRWIGSTLVLAVLVHVTGLWLTSPPDVIDALLLRSPTPFSVWGVVAMWAVFAAALLAALRRRMRSQLNRWRFAHTALTAVVVVSSVIHAMQIEGTMGTASKATLCALTLAATVWVIVDLRSWILLIR